MKKIFGYIILVMSVFAIFIFRARAEEVNIDDVLSKYEEKLKSNFKENISVEKDEGKITVKDEESTILEYTLEDNIISSEVTLEINEEDIGDIFSSVVVAMYHQILLDTIAEEKGYSEREIRLFLAKDWEEATIDNNGYEIKTSRELDEKVKVSFKVDIDKFKISAVYNNVEAPTLKFSDILENSISIGAYVDLEKVKEEIEEEVMVEIYRSVDKENYEYIGSISAVDINNDNSSFTISDDNLLSNTTYYYKAVVEYSQNYSQIYEVKTKEVSENVISLYLVSTKDGVLINIEADVLDNSKVKIYRSSDNNDFKLVNETTILNGEATFLDNTAKVNESYYYKVVINDEENEYEKIDAVKFVGEVEVENPDTGIKNYIFIGGIIALIGVVLLVIVSKRKHY